MWYEFLPVKDEEKAFCVADSLRSICREVKIEKVEKGWKLSFMMRGGNKNGHKNSCRLGRRQHE